MSTLRQVAEKAGVSVETVSRVLNGKLKETWPSSIRRADRIRKLAVDLGYFPNAAARAVKTGRFGQIACAVSEYRWHRAQPLVSGQLRYVDVVTKLLADRGYSTIVEPFYVDLKTNEFVETSRLFSEIAVDGIVGVELCGYISPEIDQRIQDMGAPIVWLNRNNEKGIHSVRCDEAMGARLLVEHLVSLGHRRIGHFGLDGPHYSCKVRAEAISDALTERGLDTSNVVLAGKELPIMKAALRLLQVQTRPTAIICYDRTRYDLLLLLASSLGLRTPQDLSLCCFAGPDETLFEEYSITSAVIPEGEISEVGVRALIERIETHQAAGEIPEIAPSLHVGVTTASPTENT